MFKIQRYPKPLYAANFKLKTSGLYLFNEAGELVMVLGPGNWETIENLEVKFDAEPVVKVPNQVTVLKQYTWESDGAGTQTVIFTTAFMDHFKKNNKIQAIKELRTTNYGMGLGEAKNIADAFWYDNPGGYI